ncbi:MAG: aminotransferase class I/II-fold pyridoxal phosphate-dependent enzyme [Bacilli bacterium]|nr:aminotransferase class I/II-fold pyridoxal phosphate-dependent enzyme [Bacilli bacterium]
MFINKESEKRKLKNNILALAKEAAKAKSGDPSVINATAGSLKNENGSLYEFSCVADVMKTLSTTEKFAYSDSLGSATFTKAVLTALFGNHLEEVKESNYLGCIPTPGGTGGLNLAFSNYIEKGDTVLLPNHMWENYLCLAEEIGVKTETYALFNEEGAFNVADLKARVASLKNKQSRILILINDPCENPTGFCMEESDYDALINISKENPETDFVYLMDVAYFDFYNVDPDIIRSRYAKFKGLPKNAMSLFVFSGSKSFGLYGLRIGALVALTREEKETIAFNDANGFSSRTRWSSASTLGISIIEKLMLEEKYVKSYQEEIREVCSMLEERSIAFLKAAKEAGLKTLPYQKGFFLCIPFKDPEKLMNALHEDGVYAICTKSCLRIALCAINKEEASRLPSIIKRRIDLIK